MSRAEGISFWYTSVHLIDSMCSAMVASGNATSHQSINYKSNHITLHVPNYKNPSQPDKPATHNFSISSTLLHDSESQLKNCKDYLNNILHILNGSPFGQRARLILTVTAILKILKGMHSDYAKNYKKLVCLVFSWKQEIICLELG